MGEVLTDHVSTPRGELCGKDWRGSDYQRVRVHSRDLCLLLKKVPSLPAHLRGTCRRRILCHNILQLANAGFQVRDVRIADTHLKLDG